MKTNRDVKVKLELDYIDASVLMEAVNVQLDALLKQPSLENVAKYIVLREIGKSMVDQIMPKDQQEILMQKSHQDKIILQALKKERGE